MVPTSRIALLVAAAAAFAGCGIPSQTTQLQAGPVPVTVRLEPALPTTGQSAELTIESPSADSIVFESENGLDRYWSDRGALHVRLEPNFGDSVPVNRYAVRWQGQLLSRYMKPTWIKVCRLGRCQEVYHEIAIELPEANRSTVAITAGYSTVFARRLLTGSHRTVLFSEALSSGIASLQAEWTNRGWSARLQGVAGRGDRGASIDLSREVKRAGDVSYGVAMHVDADQSEWLPETESPVLAHRTTWRAGIGPSLMLRGITASSQLGIFSDGAQTLQIVSTRVSVNGNLTEVRLPVSLTAEKTFAFGGGEIISRRRDALERITAGIHLFDAFSLNLGIANHQSAWPNQEPVNDFRASETLFTLGGQYSLTW